MLLDPMAARVRASSINIWEASGRCLQFVNWAYGEPGSRMTSNGRGTTPDGNWQDAKEGWYGSLHQHPGDGTDAPAGVPIYWETGPSGNPAGHIVISDGDGYCYTTDYAGPRSVSRQSIAYLNRLRGTALGWTEDFGGNPIAGITTASLDQTPFVPPTPKKEDPTVIIISSPSYGQISVTDSAGAFPIDNSTGNAVILREAYPATDFDDDKQVEVIITEAWRRAYYDRGQDADAVAEKVKETLNAARK